MTALPARGSYVWDTPLNDFLLVEHNSDGTLRNVSRPSEVSAKYTKPSLGIPYSDLTAEVRASLDAASSGNAPDATTTTKGIVKLTGDLGGTALSPTVPGLANKVSTNDTRLSDNRTPLDGSVTAAKVASNAAITKSQLAPLALVDADINSISTAVITGLGNAASKNVGTTTGTVAAGDDSRLTNARTPIAHAATHATGNTDPISPASIGADTATLRDAAIATHAAATDPHGDRAYADTNKLAKSANLSDVASVSIARTSLGLGGAATLSVGTTTGTVAAGDDSRLFAPSNFNPTDYNWLAWTQDPFFASGTFTLTSGTIFLSKVVLRRAVTVTNTIMAITTAGATLTSGQCLMGLYDISGNQVGISADQSANWTSTGTKTVPLGTPYAAAAGFYYIAMLAVGTTPPVIAAGPTPSNGPAASIGLAVGTARFLSGPTGQTSLPSTITMGSTSINTGTKWCAVS